MTCCLLSDVSHLGYSCTSGHLPQTVSRERKKSFKGFIGFLMANIKQNGWCFTNTLCNGEREVGSSAMATTAAVCTVIYMVDSSGDYVTEQAMQESKHKPFFNQCSIFSVIAGTVYGLFKALNITILNP